MTRTTDDWEALREAATPAPWEALREDDTPVWTIGRLGDTPARIVGDVYGEDNARMIASAPDLAHTVIAQAEQIKRLRAAVKELSREMEGYRPHEVAWVELTHDDIFKFEDMEDTDD